MSSPRRLSCLYLEWLFASDSRKEDRALAFMGLRDDASLVTRYASKLWASYGLAKIPWMKTSDPDSGVSVDKS